MYWMIDWALFRSANASICHYTTTPLILLIYILLAVIMHIMVSQLLIHFKFENLPLKFFGYFARAERV
jgi:hypothetical protein